MRRARDDAAPEQLPDKSCGFFAYVDLGFKPAPAACLFAIPVSKLCVGIEVVIQCSAQANSRHGCGFVAYVHSSFKPAPVPMLFAMPFSQLGVGIHRDK